MTRWSAADVESGRTCPDTADARNCRTLHTGADLQHHQFTALFGVDKRVQVVATNGRLEHLRGSALDLRNLTNYIT